MSCNGCRHQIVEFRYRCSDGEVLSAEVCQKTLRTIRVETPLGTIENEGCGHPDPMPNWPQGAIP